MWRRVVLQLLYGHSWRTLDALDQRIEATGWTPDEAHRSAYWQLDRALHQHPEWLATSQKQLAAEHLTAMMPVRCPELARVLVLMAAERMRVEDAG